MRQKKFLAIFSTTFFQKILHFFIFTYSSAGYFEILVRDRLEMNAYPNTHEYDLVTSTYWIILGYELVIGHEVLNEILVLHDLSSLELR